MILALLGTFGLWKASTAASGPTFLIYLLGTLVAMGFLPVLIYRMSALQQGRYILARDGISLYWGLRHEEIPINKVTWVGSTDQNRMVLTKPAFRVPGGVLGVKETGRWTSGGVHGGARYKSSDDRHVRAYIRHLSRQPD